MSNESHQRSFILRGIGWLLMVTLLFAILFVLLPPPSPAVEFVRYTTDANGRTAVVCRVTNRSLRPVGIFGHTPTFALWQVQDPATGVYLRGGGCFSGAEFHGLAPSESREFQITAPKTKAAQVRYGIIYGSPFEEIRTLHGIVCEKSFVDIAWTPGLPSLPAAAGHR